MQRICAASHSVRSVLHSAALRPLGREDGAHALLRGQTGSSLGANIFHFMDNDEGHQDIATAEELPQRVRHVGIRTVRIAATYADDSGRVRDSLLTFGSGLLIGDRLLTAVQNVSSRAESASSDAVGRLHKIYYRSHWAAAVNAATSSGTAICIAELERWWRVATYDHEAQAAVEAAAAALPLLDRDGTLWPHRAGIAVLRKIASTPARPSVPVPLPLPPLSCDDFAAPSAAGAAAGAGANHYLIGYPSVPSDLSVLVNRVRQWQGQITRQQLVDVFGGFQRKVVSRGVQREQLLQLLPEAAAPQQPLYLPPQRPCYYLHGHFANALGGMAGGPVLDGEGRVRGFHVGGRKDSGRYNAYIGTDHPAVAAALAAAGIAGR